MSEYLSKKAVLEWLDDRRYKSPWIESFRERLESGAFDINQALSTTTEPKQDKTCVICGTREGKYLSTANRWFCEPCTDALPPVNANEAKVERVSEEIKGLLEVWDFRGIAEQLESGYERGVVIELVELCEKLTGAKSPRVNAPEGDWNDA